jgi:flavorubredoxin/flavin reductase (DIM6/NTAB) family NADH-FMN oxidoreductase RutF/rubredoxin
MHCYQKISQDLYWVGGNDRRLALFENVFPIPRGVSYNAYLELDEKTVLLDTVDTAVSAVFFENLKALLNGRTLDYLIVNHMEPDHCAMIEQVLLRYPEACIVANAKALAMIRQFFTLDAAVKTLQVKEGDTLCTGRHTFSFVMAPMVHWPEVMVTYDAADRVLFSADAFGTFGALGGNLFADQVNFFDRWMDDARRYYTNIVGKYGTQVQALLKKAAGLDIAMICPLHGPLWRRDIGKFIEKYDLWSRYQPEEQAVVIAYASVYGNTQTAAEQLALRLGALGLNDVRLYDVSATHPSELVAEAFRVSHLVFASTTYNAGIFCNMQTLLHDLTAHNLQNRTVALLENGSWAATSGALMRQELEKCRNMTFLDPVVSLRSALKEEQLPALDQLAQAICDSMPRPAQPDHAQRIDPDALHRLSYGLFVLTAQENGRDNGCIINTVQQAAENPTRITIAVNKQNLTHDIISRTGVFNVSVLTTQTPFSVFERFGFASGRDTDKFAGFDAAARTENGLLYLTEHANAVLCAKVLETIDCGTHTLFVAQVTQACVLCGAPSVTYQYYFDHIKPRPQQPQEGKKGFVCQICGYVYEGDVLPEDFICPLCKHGAQDFAALT